MESIVKFLEKGQPYFDKVSKNIYLQAIKDGFLAAMPIILSSSVFLLISTLPALSPRSAALRCPTGGTSTS